MKSYLLLFAAALMAGCSKNDAPTPSEGGESTPVDFIMTYATAPVENTTYRVMCYDKDNSIYSGTGTYRFVLDKKSTSNRHERSLMPCKVNDDGSWTGTDGSAYALAIYDQSYDRYITIVSPARSFTPGTFNKFTLNRTEAFWATSPKAWRLNGYRIIDQGENLKDLRSRVAFSFYRGENVASSVAISVGDLTLTDAGSTAEWIPNTGAITTSGSDPVIPMRAATAAERTVEPSLLFVNDAAEYVFASTYGSNDVKTIKVEFDLTVGGSTSREKYILARTLEKMKYYKFNFTVTSTQITLALEVFDLGSDVHLWQLGSHVEGYGSIGDPESTLTLGSWTIGSSWENGGGGSGTIG